MTALHLFLLEGPHCSIVENIQSQDDKRFPTDHSLALCWGGFRGRKSDGCCSVTQLCLTFCHPLDCSTPGFPIFHYLLQFTQIHVHWFGDAIQLSPLMVDLSFIWYPCTEISLRALPWWAHCCDQNQQLSKLWQGPSTGNRAFGQHTHTHTHTHTHEIGALPRQAALAVGSSLLPSVGPR